MMRNHKMWHIGPKLQEALDIIRAADVRWHSGREEEVIERKSDNLADRYPDAVAGRTTQVNPIAALAEALHAYLHAEGLIVHDDEAWHVRVCEGLVEQVATAGFAIVNRDTMRRAAYQVMSYGTDQPTTATDAMADNMFAAIAAPAAEPDKRCPVCDVPVDEYGNGPGGRTHTNAHRAAAEPEERGAHPESRRITGSQGKQARRAAEPEAEGRHIAGPRIRGHIGEPDSDQRTISSELFYDLLHLSEIGHQPMYNGRPSCPICENFLDNEETHDPTCSLLEIQEGERVERKERDV